MAVRHPGSALTREEIAVGQGLLTALLIHLSGGGQIRDARRAVRSLAFLAMYRDPTVVLLASFIGIIDDVQRSYSMVRRVRRPPGALGLVHRYDLRGDRGRALAPGHRKEPGRHPGRRPQAGDHRRRAGRRSSARWPNASAPSGCCRCNTSSPGCLAGSGSLVEATPFILRIMGENQGWQVGELWEVEEGRQFMRSVDVWHADGLRRTRVLERRRATRVSPRRRAAGTGLAAAPAALDLRSGGGAHAADGRFLERIRAARRVRHPAAQRSRGDRRDGLLQRRDPAGQRRSPLDAERAGRPDRAVHGAQAGRAGAARQRGALPLGDRGARRRDDPGRRRGERDGHQRQLRADPGPLVGRDGLGARRPRPSPRRSTRRERAGRRRRAAVPDHAPDSGSRGRTWCSA